MEWVSLALLTPPRSPELSMCSHSVGPLSLLFLPDSSLGDIYQTPSYLFIKQLRPQI